MSDEFDFNTFYEKGDTIFFVCVHKGYINSKEIYELHVRTIYPRFMVGTLESGGCVCVSEPDKDYIFTNYVDAKLYYDSLEEYEEENNNE